MPGVKRTRVTKKTYAKRRRIGTKSGTRTSGVNPGVATKVPSSVSSSWVNFGYGFPAKVKVIHKYYDQFNLNSALGVLTSYQFHANGMYDPNITGTGHQPQYFDQLAAVYDHYVVIGSKITIMPAGNLDSNRGFQVCAYLNDDTSIVGSFESAAQQTDAVSGVYSSSRENPNLELTYSAKKVYGGNIMNNAQMMGTGSVDPTEKSVYTILMKATDPAATDCNVSFAVMIEYIAVWFELKDIEKS